MSTAAKDNGPSEADVREAFSAILSFHEELESERGTYMQRCREIRSQIADVYDTAKDKGVTKKVLKAAVKEHSLRQKADACREDLEADEQREYDILAQKLGDLADLPLGRAALGPNPGETTLDSLTH